MSRVVFWDFDGTLARRDGMWAGALVDALVRVTGSTQLTADSFRPHLRRRFPWHTPEQAVRHRDAESWWAALHPVLMDAFIATGTSPQIASRAVLLVGEEYYRVDSWELVCGATDALALTRNRGYRNVVLSNHAPELPGLVSALGLDDLVDRVICSAMVGAEKPNPLIFRQAIDLTGADPDSWMVGDNPVADVAGAEAVGMRAILADGCYPDARGVTVLEAARRIVSEIPSGSGVGAQAGEGQDARRVADA